MFFLMKLTGSRLTSVPVANLKLIDSPAHGFVDTSFRLHRSGHGIYETKSITTELSSSFGSNGALAYFGEMFVFMFLTIGTNFPVRGTMRPLV